LFSSPAFAADPRVVIFGGGWGAEGTQASIEEHVALLAKVLAPSRPAVLFAGEPDTRSVQVALQEDDPIDRVLGVLFDRRDHLHVGYRKKKIQSGTASKETLLATIAAHTAPEGLIVLGAGHASRAEGDRDAALDLWGPDDKLSVSELAKHLDRTAKGSVAFVLGQCHSGAFADLMYRGGKGPSLAKPERCVLAAVPADREASGCTPDVDDPEADAYMAMIAEALEKRADFDGDGATSLAEAHAYARIHDRTIDVPVASSELWLFARLGSRLPRVEGVRLPSLLQSARPTERAVLEGIEGGRLLRAGPRAVAEALDALEAEIDEGAKKLDAVLDERDAIRRRLVDRVLTKWPELVNPYHRVSRNLLAGDAVEVVEMVKQQPEWIQLLEKDEEIGARDRQLFSLEKQAAQIPRFVRAVQVVAGERLLSKNDRRTFSALLACEAMKPKIRQP
jgi:hypothetical protein